MSLSLDGTNGLTFDTGGSPINNLSSVNGGQLAGMRNRIINGRFDHWQRGTSLSSGLTTYTYLADRFCVYAAGAAVTVSKTPSLNPVTGYGVANLNGIGFAGAVGNTFVDLTQRIEAAEVNAGLRGTVTFSAWVYQNTGSSMTPLMLFGCPSATDNYTGSTQYGSVSISAVSSGVWTKISATVDTSGYAEISKGLYATIRFPNLTTGNVYCTLVQLEVGSVATPFEQRPIGLEQSLCRRYTRKQVVPVNNATDVFTFMPIDMRVTPTSITGGGAGFTTTGTTADSLICYQTTRGNQTLLLEAEL